ncbi:hypothetical protein RCOM_1434180 [Ricinus communis]|uniref:Uncharacterized protein n=2 Tax=Ricinus communis TaxID=3988 RepID=B9RFF5_RICCO|nr:hypothetical protein RCOM_1434180 [Ricinus communis]
MQERSSGYYGNGDHTKKKKKKWYISKRVSLIFSSVFSSSKKSLPKSHSTEVPRNDDDSNHSSSAESQLLKRTESDGTSPFRKILETENEEQRKANMEKKANNKKPSKAGSSSLSRFFHKKSCSFNCMRVKINKIDINSSLSTSTSFSSTRSSFRFNSQNSCSSTGRVAEIMGRQGSTHSLPRVPSRILTTKQKLKMAHSLTKMGSRRKSRSEDRDECESLIRMESGRKSEWEDRGGGVELCKKRILMGGKCRPLNNSGTLQYDKDGVLLPDIIP